MRLSRAKEPFDSRDFIFEVKIDGFRCLAYIDNGDCKLVSRNGHVFRGFAELCGAVARSLKVKNAILDGELCCLGQDGRSMFNLLLFRKGLPYYYAFDLLWLNGNDLRKWPLIKRKEKLKKVIPELPSRILFTPHLDGQGVQLFHEACKIDLEGIVAKKKDAPYYSDERNPAWIKIKNPQYSQIQGRHELFSAR